MKRSIIIIVAMVFFMAIPVLASTPETENAPTPTGEDQKFIDLTLLTEDQMIYIIGNVNSLMSDGASNVNIIGISSSHIETNTISININLETFIPSIGVSSSNTASSGYSSYTDPNTGITTVTYTWNSGNTTYSMTWQVNENAGTYLTASNSTHQSGYSDAGASRPN